MSQSPFHGIFGSIDDSNIGFEPSNHQIDEEIELEPVFTSSSTKKVGQIAVDIYEVDNYYVVRAPIAGVRMSDIDIEIDGKIITISGVRKLNESIEDKNYFLKECFWGEFSRSITLPMAIDQKKVKATFSKDSILKILVPKEDRVRIVRVSEGG